MSVRTTTYYSCDVCSKTYYSADMITQVTFSYDDRSHAFDACYECFRGSEKVKSIYRKIIDSALLWKRKKEGV